MWDLPGPGLEPVPPALADGFLTTAPPGKPTSVSFIGFYLFNILFIWRLNVVIHNFLEGYQCILGVKIYWCK